MTDPLAVDRHPPVLGVQPRRGPVPPTRRLTDADVVAIRELRAKGATLRTIAGQFGVHPSTVCKVCLGIARADVGGPRTPRDSNTMGTW